MKTSICLAAGLACVSTAALAQSQPWLDKTKSADERAAAAVSAMTLEEKLGLVMGYTDPDKLAKEPDDIVSPAIKAD
eukprot:gene19546-24751_t